MGKIVLFLGPSLAGQEILKARLMKEEQYHFHKIIKTITRPKRCDEIDGDTYHFIDDESTITNSEIIEKKQFGEISYFTCSKDIDLEKNNYIDVSNLERLDNYRNYFGVESIIPIFVRMNRDDRIQLVLTTERAKENPNYKEMCERYLDDAHEYNEEKVAKSNITDVVENNGDIEDMVLKTKIILAKRLYK